MTKDPNKPTSIFERGADAMIAFFKRLGKTSFMQGIYRSCMRFEERYKELTLPLYQKAEKFKQQHLVSLSIKIDAFYKKHLRLSKDKPKQDYENNEDIEYETSMLDRAALIFNVAYDLIKKLVMSLVALIFLLGILVMGVAFGYFNSLTAEMPIPSKTEMVQEFTNLERLSSIYYASGEKIADIRSDIVREPIPISFISPFVIDALIATEDENFYEHEGIVPKALIRAVITDLTGMGSTSGGSTITQQVIKQSILTNEVTYSRKAKEILLAMKAENYFTKDEILEAYLNISSYGRNYKGENIAGIESAALGVFGLHADQLNLPQAAFLVGIPQLPYLYTPYTQEAQFSEDLEPAMERYHFVLERMLLLDKITQKQYDEAMAYDIKADFLAPDDTQQQTSTYLYQAIRNQTIDLIMEKNIIRDKRTVEAVEANEEMYDKYYNDAITELAQSGYHIKTTINKEIYNAMQLVTRENASRFGLTYTTDNNDPITGEKKPIIERVENGSVMMENATGKILGFIAGVDYLTNNVDHAFNARRSPGSTIKPIIAYGPAINEGIVHPAALISDKAFDIVLPNGDRYRPTNFGGTVSNRNVTARQALAYSYNVPAINVYNQMMKQGVDIQSYGDKMGLSKAIAPEEYSHLSLSIGGTTTGPTVEEQTNAFATIANNGDFVDAYMIESIESHDGKIVYQHESKPVSVFTPSANYLNVDMLRSVFASGTMTGYKQQLYSAGNDWIAKTGTSEHFGDVWVIGSTPTVTISSWMGYDKTLKNRTLEDDWQNYTYGGPDARNSQHWVRIVNAVSQAAPSYFENNYIFIKPEGVVSQLVNPSTGTINGTFLYDGVLYRLSNASQSTIVDANHLPEPRYDFIIGGQQSEFDQFWRRRTTR